MFWLFRLIFAFDLKCDSLLIQENSGQLTVVCGGCPQVCMSNIYGYFDPAVMKVMTNMEEINILYTHIEPGPFIESIINHINLYDRLWPVYCIPTI